MDLKFNSVVRQDSWTEKKKKKIKVKKPEITAIMLSPKYSQNLFRSVFFLLSRNHITKNIS